MNSQNTISKAAIGRALTLSLALCLSGSVALCTNTAYADEASASSVPFCKRSEINWRHFQRRKSWAGAHRIFSMADSAVLQEHRLT